jgi:predicted metal-dependent hydrolase
MKKLTGAMVGIPPRHIEFRFPESVPRYFYGGNATATIFFAMLSAFFPPGERYFMESVRPFRNRVKDESLRAAVSGFMGQEAIHGREHDRLNEMLAERGFDMKAPDRFVKIGLAFLEKLPASTRLPPLPSWNISRHCSRSNCLRMRNSGSRRIRK